MDKKYFGLKFYGSILNTVLLLVLIVLMFVAIGIMRKNPGVYFPELAGKSKCAVQNDVNLATTGSQDDNKILGNKDDLISFSVLPGTKLQGVVSYNGIIKGGYFFEGNILINVLDSNKKTIINGHANSKTDWMTSGPVEFEGSVDLTKLTKGPAYIEIHNDNASGLPENDKSILIPIIIN